jgi:hypothetical protein
MNNRPQSLPMLIDSKTESKESVESTFISIDESKQAQAPHIIIDIPPSAYVNSITLSNLAIPDSQQAPARQLIAEIKAVEELLYNKLTYLDLQGCNLLKARQWTIILILLAAGGGLFGQYGATDSKSAEGGGIVLSSLSFLLMLPLLINEFLVRYMARRNRENAAGCIYRGCEGVEVAHLTPTNIEEIKAIFDKIGQPGSINNDELNGINDEDATTRGLFLRKVQLLLMTHRKTLESKIKTITSNNSKLQSHFFKTLNQLKDQKKINASLEDTSIRNLILDYAVTDLQDKPENFRPSPA